MPYLTGICEELREGVCVRYSQFLRMSPVSTSTAPNTSCKAKGGTLHRACIIYFLRNTAPSKCMFKNLNAHLFFLFFFLTALPIMAREGPRLKAEVQE